MAILLESDFLTVNLASIANAHSVTASEADTTSKEATTPNTAEDWKELLNARLAANRNLDAAARDTDYEIEAKFFREYYEANWGTKYDDNVVNRLVALGEPLKKAIKVLGFDSKTNPILAFVSDGFVINSLIVGSNLLNATTFTAIYNAVAKRLVAQSQFLKSNDYNIIYCPNLYTKSAAEMLEYLKLQSQILHPKAANYTKADISKNKKVFLALQNISDKEFSKTIKQIAAYNTESVSVKNLKLNSIELASELNTRLGTNNSTEKSDSTAKNKQVLSNKVKVRIANKLNTSASKLAALQYISMISNNALAKKALMNNRLGDVQSDNLIKATIALTNDSDITAILQQNPDEVVKLIVNSL